MEGLCSIESCNKNARIRGWCDMHYTRWVRHGSSMGGRPRQKDGDGCLRPTGYIVTQINKRRVANHIRVAENALGKELPKGAQVHHVNGNRSDNRPENLVICQDESYHHLIHMRTDAINNGFPPHYRRCHFCKKHDNPDLMKETRNAYRHAACKRAYEERRKVISG